MVSQSQLRAGRPMAVALLVQRTKRQPTSRPSRAFLQFSPCGSSASRHVGAVDRRRAQAFLAGHQQAQPVDPQPCLVRDRKGALADKLLRGTQGASEPMSRSRVLDRSAGGADGPNTPPHSTSDKGDASHFPSSCIVAPRPTAPHLAYGMRSS